MQNIRMAVSLKKKKRIAILKTSVVLTICLDLECDTVCSLSEEWRWSKDRSGQCVGININ